MSHWSDLAACKGHDTDAWFPEQGGSATLAKRICAEGHVRSECLRFALDNREPEGVWGGLSVVERDIILRRKRERWGRRSA